MPFRLTLRPSLLPGFAALVLLLRAAPAGAQVKDVVVGVTPTCPYGLSACWAGAYEGLGHLEGVESVAAAPDAYNCTAHVHLKGKGLPDLDKWPEQFKAAVGDAYVFRGVEVTAKGSVSEKDGNLVLDVPGLGRPFSLAPLEHKLQWNFRKGSARQPEEDEKNAYRQLAAKSKDAKSGGLRVEVTGPLRATGKGLTLEVREFFLVTPEAGRHN